MIGSHRTLGERLARKDAEADIVVGAPDDKLCCHLLGGLDAVRAQVLGEHTRRDVHRQHDIDTLNSLALP